MGLFDTTSKMMSEQGDIGVAHAVTWFATQGYVVCFPIGEHQDFDLVVVKGSGKAEKVQVKTTRHKTDYGIYEVQLRTKGGNRSWSGVSKTFSECSADLLFVVTDSEHYYLIPRKEISNTASLNLGSRVERFRVK